MSMISVQELKPDTKELTARLGGMPPGQAEELIAQCDAILQPMMMCRYTYRETSVRISENVCDFGFCSVRSAGLAKNLSGRRRALFFAATLGIGVDRLLTRLRAESELKRYVCDALASAYAEALCDTAQARLPYRTGVRFSPGYGDFPLAFQEKLLPYIDAVKTAGISLTAEYLMIPTKSVSAVMGICDDT